MTASTFSVPFFDFRGKLELSYLAAIEVSSPMNSETGLA